MSLFHGTEVCCTYCPRIVLQVKASLYYKTINKKIFYPFEWYWSLYGMVAVPLCSPVLSWMILHRFQNTEAKSKVIFLEKQVLVLIYLIFFSLFKWAISQNGSQYSPNKFNAHTVQFSKYKFSSVSPGAGVQ